MPSAAEHEWILPAFSLALSLMFILRLWIYLITNGADCPSNDDFVFLNLLEKISQPGYNWFGFFTDTFINGHSFAIGELLFMTFAYVFSLNQIVGISIGCFFAIVRLFLIHNLLFSDSPEVMKWMSLPVLSMLLFSSSQAPILEHGTFAITWEFSLLCAAVALWSAKQLKGLKGLLAETLSVCLGCWTIGVCLPVVPIISTPRAQSY